MKLSQLSGRSADFRTFRVTDELITSDVLLGVEVELENVAQDDTNPNSGLAKRLGPHWRIHYDEGSLRPRNTPSSCEFVFASPMAGEDAATALKRLDEEISELPYLPVRSIRTSLHVHLDANNLTYEKLLAFLVLYVSVEKLLYNYCGKHRENSVFCVPLFKIDWADTPLTETKQISNREEESLFISKFKRQHDSTVRYAGLNLSSLLKYGSIELRMHPGEWKYSSTLRWVNILLSLYKAAINLDEPMDGLPARASQVGIPGWVESIFGNYTKYLVYDGYIEDVYEGLRLGQDLLFRKNMRKVVWEIVYNQGDDKDTDAIAAKSKWINENQ